MLEFVSVGLTLDRFTLTKDAVEPENYVLQLVLIKLIKINHLFTTLSSYIYIYIYIYIRMYIRGGHTAARDSYVAL